MLLEFGAAAVAKETRRAYARTERRHEQGLIFPIEHMHVDLVSRPRRRSPIARRDRTAAGAVDRWAVLLEPLADLSQAGHELRLNRPVRHRADVEQEVRVVTGRAREVVHEIACALVPAVVDVETPGPVDRVAGFERQFTDRRLGVESRGVTAWEIFLPHLKVFTRKRPAMMVRAYERA